MRIVLAEDHGLVREGLCALLGCASDIELVGQAEDGLAALALVQRLRPDVLLTDVSMPGLNGIECARRVRASDEGVRVLCLSMHADTRTVMSAIEAGASGYLLKDACSAELLQALRTVAAGRVHLSADLVGLLVACRGSRPGGAAAVRTAALSAREREVAQLLSEGFSTKQAAERLFISAKTVATHRENIMHKLDIRSMAELTRYALQEGLSSLTQRAESAGSVAQPLSNRPSPSPL